MHAALQTILRLYREPLPFGVPPAHEPAEEVSALAGVRDALDTRPKARPDAFVLDAILAAAAHHAPVGPPESLGQRYDRQPVPRAKTRLRRALTVAAAGSVLAAFAVIVWLPGGDAAPALAVAEAPVPVAVPMSAAPTEITTLAVATPPTAAPATKPIAEAVASTHPSATVEPSKPAAKDVTTAWDVPEATKAVQIVEERAAALSSRLDSTLWELPSSSSLALPRPTGTPSRYTQTSLGSND
ncbi:MAG: hypothetical protein IAE99_08430 [Rhodothermales bacterium]|nr:hypothetical protein [Rhodothermales bacterium]MCA0270167.1 hypothetical protein [Bacteroidota bacterium]